MSRRKLLWLKRVEQGDVEMMFPHRNVEGRGVWGTGVAEKSKGAGKGVGTICTRAMSTEMQSKIKRWVSEPRKRN
jgi:hypothetical protein